jgi:hypothetical protein
MTTENNAQPKTFAEDLHSWLQTNGMSETQTEAVLAKMLAGESENAAKLPLDRVMKGYPEALTYLLRRICAKYALTYIDENCPAAWFRPCFLPQEEQLELLEEFRKEDAVQAAS